MKQYFAISDYGTQPKNALQKAIQLYVKTKNGTLINNVTKFKSLFNQSIASLNAQHARCKAENIGNMLTKVVEYTT